MSFFYFFSQAKFITSMLPCRELKRKQQGTLLVWEYALYILHLCPPDFIMCQYFPLYPFHYDAIGSFCQSSMYLLYGTTCSCCLFPKNRNNFNISRNKIELGEEVCAKNTNNVVIG